MSTITGSNMVYLRLVHRIQTCYKAAEHVYTTGGNYVYTFGFDNEVRNMICRGYVWSRAHWRGIIWKRAWELEDLYWCVKSRSLDLLSKICTTTRYIIWWQIADKFPRLIKHCEVLVKIICHASLLKVDDAKLKNLHIFVEFCRLCDHGSTDNFISISTKIFPHPYR